MNGGAGALTPFISVYRPMRYPEVSLLVGFATEDSLRKLKLEVSLLEGFALLSKWFRYLRKPRRFRY